MIRSAEKDREIINAASPGPWLDEENCTQLDLMESGLPFGCAICGDWGPENPANNRFIGEAREAWPYWLEQACHWKKRYETQLEVGTDALLSRELRIESLTEEIERLRTAMGNARNELKHIKDKEQDAIIAVAIDWVIMGISVALKGVE